MNFNGTLPNGVELYCCLNPELPEFCLSLLVRRGAIHEPRAQHGLTHFLEHAIFRSISERMGRALYPTLTRLGLTFDASTYSACVRFTVSGPSAQAETGLELLMMAIEPLCLPLDALNLERRRVQAEIREESEDDADTFAHTRVWKGTAMARSIAGTAGSVNRIGLESLAAEQARWFVAGGFCFCATGGMDEAALIGRLGGLRVAPGEPATPNAPVPEAFFRRDANVAVEDASYTWLRFCADVDTAHASPLALTLLTEALGSDYGRFYLALSEDTGLTYAVNDYFERCANIGNYYFDFETERTRVPEAVDAAVAMLNGLKHAPDDFFEDVKKGFIRREACLEGDAERFNSAWLYDNGRWRCGFQSRRQREDAYAAVPPEELRRLARAVFVPDNLLLCVRGRKRSLQVEDLRERLRRLAEE